MHLAFVPVSSVTGAAKFLLRHFLNTTRLHVIVCRHPSCRRADMMMKKVGVQRAVLSFLLKSIYLCLSFLGSLRGHQPDFMPLTL